MPKWAILTLGTKRRKVRVLNYVQPNLWRVLDRSDTVRLVSSDRLTFLK